MDGGERRQSAYREVLRALDEAIFCLEREPSGDPEDHGAVQRATCSSLRS